VKGLGGRRLAYALASLLAVAVNGCATTTVTTPTETRCYPAIYLDARYAIRGTYGGNALPVDEDNCYSLGYRDGRLVRVDYRRGGKLSPDPVSGVATVRIDYLADAERRTFYDQLGQPVRSVNAVHAVLLKFDQQNAIEWRNLGLANELTEDKTSQVAMIRWKYDTQNRVIEESHYGTSQQLTPDARRGVAIVRWKYDADGNTLEESYFGADGRPTIDRVRGVASVRWGYGTHGKTVEESYFGPDGRRMPDKNRSVAVVRWQYDEAWNTIEERYFGSDLRPMADRRLGAAIIRWQYDRYGREVGRSMFDPDERPVRETRN
jgi:hypothetical protein